MIRIHERRKNGARRRRFHFCRDNQFWKEHLSGLPLGSPPKAVTVQAMLLPTPTFFSNQLPLRPNATQPVPLVTEQVPPRSAHLLKPSG